MPGWGAAAQLLPGNDFTECLFLIVARQGQAAGIGIATGAAVGVCKDADDDGTEH
mgnify:CR=1 FL=1